MEEGRRNHGVYGQDNAYDMFINIKVERPNNRKLSIPLLAFILMILNTYNGCPEGEFLSSQPKRKKDAATMACIWTWYSLER